MGEFRMPSLGADMEAGTLVEWLKKPGEAVKRGDIIAVVETQKGAIEIEIFDSGTVDRLLVEAGVKVPVGTPLAVIRAAGEAPVPAAPPPKLARPLPVAAARPCPDFTGGAQARCRARRGAGRDQGHGAGRRRRQRRHRARRPGPRW
jgi:pyruvate dehydrogenase E2 component (dihydrolipoamide acetyltransferase)